jgi:hypothetical protein
MSSGSKKQDMGADILLHHILIFGKRCLDFVLRKVLRPILSGPLKFIGPQTKRIGSLFTKILVIVKITFGYFL